jgi:hypothetical protein
MVQAPGCFCLPIRLCILTIEPSTDFLLLFSFCRTPTLGTLALTGQHYYSYAHPVTLDAKLESWDSLRAVHNSWNSTMNSALRSKQSRNNAARRRFMVHPDDVRLQASPGCTSNDADSWRREKRRRPKRWCSAFCMKVISSTWTSPGNQNVCNTQWPQIPPCHDDEHVSNAIGCTMISPAS